MKMSTTNTFSILSFLFFIFITAQALRPYHFGQQSRSRSRVGSEEGHMEIGMELYPTGSSLPDCSHACGACTPCHRVIISFNKCAVESCPIVYRCTCKGKYYHVPSN
ncbi:hypothetical protein ACS0TY_023138 [Phlomoides rotata]